MNYLKREMIVTFPYFPLYQILDDKMAKRAKLDWILLNERVSFLKRGVKPMVVGTYVF